MFGQTSTRWLTLACCVLLQSAGSGRTDEPALSGEIAQALEAIREKHKLPALAGAIVTSRGLLAAAAVGKRRVTSDVPVTVDDLWHMGSCTKALTASMIASLVEEGKIGWDTTVEQSFPDVADRLPTDLRQVTVLQLLSHRSGLPANLAWGRFSRDEPLEAQRASVLRFLMPIQLGSKPGTKFGYSNLGYVVAAMMAERATKTSWEDLLRRRLFQPLDMQEATFRGLGDYDNLDRPWPHGIDGRPIGDNAPVRGDAAGNPLQGVLDSFRIGSYRLLIGVVLGDDGEAPVAGPAGSTLRLSLQDWSKFVADHLRGDRGEPALFKPESYAVLHKPPLGGNYAFGWGVMERPWGHGLVLTHSGSNGLNYSVVWIAPKRDFAVLVCTNQAVPSGQQGVDVSAGQLIKLYERHFPAAKPAEQNGKPADQ